MYRMWLVHRRFSLETGHQHLHYKCPGMLGRCEDPGLLGPMGRVMYQWASDRDVSSSLGDGEFKAYKLMFSCQPSQLPHGQPPGWLTAQNLQRKRSYKAQVQMEAKMARIWFSQNNEERGKPYIFTKHTVRVSASPSSSHHLLQLSRLPVSVSVCTRTIKTKKVEILAKNSLTLKECDPPHHVKNGRVLS